MTTVSKLIELSKANCGFTGGSFVDTHKDMSIDECIQSVNACLFESIIEYSEASQRLNDIVYNTLTESVAAGEIADLKDVIDEANEDAANKKQSIWEKIKAFIGSIIAKISSWLTSLKPRQKVIANRKNDFLTAMNGPAKTTEINGFPFVDLIKRNTISVDALTINSYADLSQITGITSGEASEKSAVVANVDAWAADKLGMKDIAGNDFKANLKKKLYGADQAQKLKLSTFDANAIIDFLVNAKTIQECDKKYRNMSRIVDEGIRENRRDAAKGMKTAKKAGEEPNEETQRMANSSQLMEGALAEYNAIVAVIFAYAQAAMRQAWTIFNTALKGAPAEQQPNPTPKQNTAQKPVGESAEAADSNKPDKNDKTKNEEAVDDTDDLKSAYDETSDELSDDDWDFTI